RLYELEFLEAVGRPVRLLPAHEVVGMQHGSAGCDLALRERWGAQRTVRADIVVLGTGYSYALPEAMEPLADRISWDRDGLSVRADFSVEGQGPPARRC